MNIEELAFKDRKDLAQLNENDLLDIIEFLQSDRKQWINQFSKTYNESIDIQKENEQLKDNWNKLRECLKDIMNNSEADDKDFVKTILDIIQEIEKGSDSNDIS
jgi:hypothetical protein